MKNTCKLLLSLLLLVSVCLGLVACGKKKPSTDDVAIISSVLKSSHPTSSLTTVTYTYPTNDVYVSTYTVNADGTCSYRLEEPREFDPANPGATPVKVTEGTMTATEYTGSISVAKLAPTKDNVASVTKSTAENGNTVYTTVVKKEAANVFFGKATNTSSDLTVVYELNSAKKIATIQISYLTTKQATVISKTTFTY